MRFWQLITLWAVLTLSSLYGYHHSLAQVRSHDLAIHQTLYQEFYQIKKLPAYGALSQAVFYAKRFLKDRDALLRNSELSPMTINLCDEAVAAKKKARAQLSVFTGLTLLLGLMGALTWLHLGFKAFRSFLKANKQEQKLSNKVVMLSLALTLLLLMSRVMHSTISLPALNKLDYQNSMAVALRVDHYSQLILEGWVDLSNRIFLFHEQSGGVGDKLARIRNIEQSVASYRSRLNELQPMQSDWLKFDSQTVVNSTLKILASFEAAVLLSREWVREPSAVTNEKLLSQWSALAREYQLYLADLLGQSHAVIFESMHESFNISARRAYQKMTVSDESGERDMLKPGFELYKVMGFLN